MVSTYYKEETRQAYNKHAQKLANKFHSFFELKRRKEFPKFMELLAGKDILDIGCGSGDNARYFEDNGFSVKAIDLSEEMVTLAKEKGVDARVMDLEHLEFEDESFSGVWAVTSLLHVPKEKLSGVLEKIKDLLKKDGVFFICVKKGDGERFEEDTDLESKRFFAYYGLEELEHKLKEHFEIIESQETSVRNQTFLEVFCRKQS